MKTKEKYKELIEIKEKFIEDKFNAVVYVDLSNCKIDVVKYCSQLNNLLTKLKEGKIHILDDNQTCPFCQGKNIHTFQLQHSKCKDCKEQWTD